VNLIERLGGYAQAKALRALPAATYDCGIKFNREELELSMLEYRRQHNIFEVGDCFVNYADDAVYTALSIDQNNRMHGKSGDKNVWTYFGRFGLRHATDEEIKAGKRLEVS
jgi:hypothetical protein